MRRRCAATAARARCSIPFSRGEPFGLVLAEAMACGTPVAALDRGAVREIVEDGVTGVVFGDEAAMQQGLSRVFALDRRRVRERGIARFGAMRMVDEYITVYERLIENRSTRDAADVQTQVRA